MNLDITGKVGIENVLELLEERCDVANGELLEMTLFPNNGYEFNLQRDIDRALVEERISTFEEVIKIVKDNLPVKTK